MVTDMILLALATVATLIVSLTSLYVAIKMRDLVNITNYVADLMEERMGLRGHHGD